MHKAIEELVKAIQNVSIYDQSEVQHLRENLALAVRNCFKKYETEACMYAGKAAGSTAYTK